MGGNEGDDGPRNEADRLLPAGQIRVKLRDSGSGYSDEIEISTQGLPRLFTRFRATALAEGRRVADRPAEPSHYLAVYDLWKRHDSRVSIQFVNHTGTMIAERGPDDTSRKPPLAEAFRKNAVDPLSAIERIRAAFRAAGRVGSFTIPVYDGARRFDIVGKILPKQISSDGVLRAELTLRAIAGSTPPKLMLIPQIVGKAASAGEVPRLERSQD